ncbi:hypothetical protein phytr_7160 [Candidatus Phycorickettsia trachydisci]|uniref:Uncharacterized protein n=1 Tax=Candidatus Phycorickettsia trachydisci TaxID=2115978 RepID=A0A2P1P8R9_9RICK|nr:ankyrin repeat domain-containing protein [Candidatus Phycorickettsia trachydisci]AVP87656.1 hypothetical protein phytr_7160 [Candidatus Phycorickettsia trachydisci]
MNLELIEALRSRKEDTTLSLLSATQDINSSLDPKQNTSLHLAVKYRCKTVVEYLIEQKVELNSRNTEGLTPVNLSLTRAVADPEIACLLIKAGANFNIKCDKGFSALERAVISFYPTTTDSYSAVLDSILETGWDINTMSAKGYTALAVAVINDNLYSAKYLLDHGADPHRSKDRAIVPPEGRNSAYGYAIRSINPKMLELLDKKIDLPKSSLIHQYVRENKIEEIKQIITQDDCDLDKTDISGLTPLNLALKTDTNNKEIAAILLKAGANPNIPDASGSTPLIRASANGLHDVVELLIEKGADIHAKGSFGNTALHTAAHNKTCPPETFSLLIQHGARLDQQNQGGNTALHYAAMFGRDCIAEILILNGANPNLKNYKLQTPETLAYAYKNFSTAEVIKNFKKDGQEYKEDKFKTPFDFDAYLKEIREKYKSISSEDLTTDLSKITVDEGLSAQKLSDYEFKTSSSLQSSIDKAEQSDLTGEASETT